MSNHTPPVVYLVSDLINGTAAYTTEEAAYAAVGRYVLTDGKVPDGIDVSVVPVQGAALTSADPPATAQTSAVQRPSWLDAGDNSFRVEGRNKIYYHGYDAFTVSVDCFGDAQDADLASYIAALLNAHGDQS